MKFDDAYAELMGQIRDPDKKRRKAATPQDEAGSMAMLQSVMANTDFKGARQRR